MTPNSPAQIGETIAVYVTGLGAVFPGISDGAAGPTGQLSTTSNTIAVNVDGLPATVTYSGLAPQLAGLYQINFTVPTGVTSGEVTLGIAGPDSYSSESIIAVGTGTVAQPESVSVAKPAPMHKLPRPRGAARPDLVR